MNHEMKTTFVGDIIFILTPSSKFDFFQFPKSSRLITFKFDKPEFFSVDMKAEACHEAVLSGAGSWLFLLV